MALACPGTVLVCSNNVYSHEELDMRFRVTFATLRLPLNDVHVDSFCEVAEHLHAEQSVPVAVQRYLQACQVVDPQGHQPVEDRDVLQHAKKYKLDHNEGHPSVIQEKRAERGRHGSMSWQANKKDKQTALKTTRSLEVDKTKQTSKECQSCFVLC